MPCPSPRQWSTGFHYLSEVLIAKKTQFYHSPNSQMYLSVFVSSDTIMRKSFYIYTTVINEFGLLSAILTNLD